MSYYNPQINDQFDKARKQLIYMLSDNGNLNASAGASDIAELQKARADQESQLASRALGFSNDLRGNVESAKQELYSQNSAAADPSAASRSAIARADMLTAPPVYSPIGDVFGQFINQAAARLKTSRAADTSYATPILFGGNSGSSRVVA